MAHARRRCPGPRRDGLRRPEAAAFDQHAALPVVELAGGRAILIEHALVLFQGGCRLEGQALSIDTLYYLGLGRRELVLASGEVRAYEGPRPAAPPFLARPVPRP